MRRHPKVDAYAFRYHSIFHLTATHQTIATNEMEKKIEWSNGQKWNVKIQS